MTPKYYSAPKNTVGLGGGYEIWWENLRGKSMGPVRKISHWCYSDFNMSVCNINITLNDTPNYLLSLKTARVK
jgi:hypothetical protein